MELESKILKIYENMEEYSDRVKAQDPFLTKVYEFQLKGVEFAEIQPFKNYAICTAKDAIQHNANPIEYFSVVLDGKKFKYFKLDHRNAGWDQNQAAEITEEDFAKSVVPAHTDADSDIRDDKSDYTTTDDESNPKIKEAESFKLRKDHYPEV